MELASLLAEVYFTGHDSRETWERRGYVRAYVSRALATTLPYRVSYVDVDPYQSAEEMLGQAQSSGVLAIWKGGSEGLPWEPWVNWRLRATHDSYDHIGCDFSFHGEVQACINAIARMGDAFAPLLFSEIVLQAAVFNARGFFAEQKLVNVRPEDVARYLGR